MTLLKRIYKILDISTQFPKGNYKAVYNMKLTIKQ